MYKVQMQSHSGSEIFAAADGHPSDWVTLNNPPPRGGAGQQGRSRGVGRKGRCQRLRQADRSAAVSQARQGQKHAARYRGAYRMTSRKACPDAKAQRD